MFHLAIVFMPVLLLGLGIAIIATLLTGLGLLLAALAGIVLILYAGANL